MKPHSTQDHQPQRTTWCAPAAMAFKDLALKRITEIDARLNAILQSARADQDDDWDLEDEDDWDVWDEYWTDDRQEEFDGLLDERERLSIYLDSIGVKVPRTPA